MTTQTKKVYITEDGTEYGTKEAAELAEAQTSYWAVVHSPDLTEGRGHGGITYLRVRYNGYVDINAVVQDWCFRTFHRKLAFVQGVSPMVNWTLTESTGEKWRECKPIRLGDYDHAGKQLSLVWGDRDTGLEAAN